MSSSPDTQERLAELELALEVARNDRKRAMEFSAKCHDTVRHLEAELELERRESGRLRAELDALKGNAAGEVIP